MNDDLTQIETARTWFIEGDFAAAAAECESLLHHCQDIPVRLQALGLLLRASAETQLAVEYARWQAELDNLTPPPELTAHTLLLRGQLAINTLGLRRALEILRQAYNASSDVLTRYHAGRELGFYSVGENLAQGLELLHQARTLYLGEVQPTLTPTQRQYEDHLYHEMIGRIGINTFDIGDYGGALPLLEEAYAALNGKRGTAINFLGQLYIAIGQFEQAEWLLAPATAPALQPDLYWINDLSLLGKLYLEWQQPERAAPLLRESWERATRAGYNWLITLVGNVYAEYFLQPAVCDLSQAHNIASEVLTRATAEGWNRSAVTALSLQSRAALVEGNIPLAIDAAQQSISMLQRFTQLPAVRAEEIYFHHYQALNAADDRAAFNSLQRAYSIKEAKIATLPPAYQTTMRQRIPLNIAIDQAITAHN